MVSPITLSQLCKTHSFFSLSLSLQVIIEAAEYRLQAHFSQTTQFLLCEFQLRLCIIAPHSFGRLQCVLYVPRDVQL